jgi:hypothetical protein
LQGWCNPKNCIWQVMIINDGWKPKLTICNVTRPVNLLATTPTGHLANNIPIKPTKSDIALANSLYECSNMGQLTDYYFTCLNYPVKSTLIKTINRGYLKGWRRLASQQIRCHISISTESEMGHIDRNCQGAQSTQPSLPNPRAEPVCVPDIVDDPIWAMSLRNPTTHGHISFSWPSTKLMATSSPIRLATSPSRPTVTTHILLSSTYLTPMQFAPFPSRIAQKKSFFVNIVRATPGSLSVASGHPSHKPHRTGHTHMEESFSCRHGRPFQIVSHCQLVPTHNSMQCHPQHAPSVSLNSSTLGTRGVQRFVLLQCYTHGTPQHRGSNPHETKLSTQVGLSCIQDMVLFACRKSPSMHLGFHG